MGPRYRGHERRHNGGLSDEAFEALAERAAQIVEERFYEKVGREVVRRLLLIFGAILCAALLLYFKVKFGVSFIPTHED